jgi:hypothetical protein
MPSLNELIDSIGEKGRERPGYLFAVDGWGNRELGIFAGRRPIVWLQPEEIPRTSEVAIQQTARRGTTLPERGIKAALLEIVEGRFEPVVFTIGLCVAVPQAVASSCPFRRLMVKH